MNHILKGVVGGGYPYGSLREQCMYLEGFDQRRALVCRCTNASHMANRRESRVAMMCKRTYRYTFRYRIATPHEQGLLWKHVRNRPADAPNAYHRWACRGGASNRLCRHFAGTKQSDQHLTSRVWIQDA